MLPRAHRLSGEKNFELLARRGKKLRGNLFTISILAVPANPPTKFGIVCSTKVSKKAVVRNRVRRQVSEILRLMLPQILSGAMVMVQIRPEAVGKTYDDFEKELRLLLGGVGLIKNEL